MHWWIEKLQTLSHNSAYMQHWLCPSLEYAHVFVILCWVVVIQSAIYVPKLFRIQLWYYSRASEVTLVLYLLSERMFYGKISLSLEAVRLDVIMIISLWNLTVVSAAQLPKCLSNFRATGKVWTRISRLRDFPRSCGKTPSIRLVNGGPDRCHTSTKSNKAWPCA